MIKRIIELSGQTPRFHGNARLVFIHPDDPDLFVKVIRPEWRQKSKNIPTWKKRFKPLGVNSVNMHEFNEIMRINPLPEKRLPHMFSAIGMQQTDLGWGLVVEAEKQENGDYARTLTEWTKDTRPIQDALNTFEEWIKTTPAILYDLNPWNLVVAMRDGKQEIVVIDGISEKSALKKRTYFPSINQKKNLEVFERFQRHMVRLKNTDT